MSGKDLINFGPSIGLSKDSGESIIYNGAGNTNGLGEINNNITDAVFAPASGWLGSMNAVNKGRIQRMNNTSFDPAVQSYTSVQSCNSAGKNYAVYTATSVRYFILATIPLRFLHSIFAKMPLAKGVYCRLIINTACQSQSTLTLAASVYTNIATQATCQTLPFMVSGCVTTKGFVSAAVTSAVCSIAIGKGYTSGTAHPTVTSARIYACMYEMSPIWEEQYFASTPTKTILYNDILSFQVLNIGAGASFSQILTNGISRARYLLICPQLSGAVNGSATVTAQVYTPGYVVGSPMVSPFSSAPATCCPCSFVTNFNVLLSGTNLYQSNINYRYENWLMENRQANAVNGGLSLGLSSGLLSQSDFENGYGFIYVDLSRKISQASDDISRSIQVVGLNSSAVMVDYYCIVGYERSITLSTSTGSLVI